MSISEWAVSGMESLGGPGAGLAIAAETVFPPIPNEVILRLAGFAASRGELSLAGALFWTTAGSLLGALVLYALGARLGPDRLRRAVARTPLLEPTDLDRAQAWFDRHAGRAVLLGRCVPVVRSVVSVPAGAARMPLGRFVALTVLGSGIWNSCFVLAGYALGERWTAVEAWVGAYSRAVVAAAAVAAVACAVVRVRRRRSWSG